MYLLLRLLLLGSVSYSTEISILDQTYLLIRNTNLSCRVHQWRWSFRENICSNLHVVFLCSSFCLRADWNSTRRVGWSSVPQKFWVPVRHNGKIALYCIVSSTRTFILKTMCWFSFRYICQMTFVLILMYLVFTQYCLLKLRTRRSRVFDLRHRYQHSSLRNRRIHFVSEIPRAVWKRSAIRENCASAVETDFALYVCVVCIRYKAS